MIPHRTLAALALAAFFLGGCSRAERTASGGAAPRTYVDALGDTLRVTDPPRRIISLAPSLTELVFALGAGSRLAGVTDFCDYPPAARTLPRVAGFNVVNLEALVAARADLVLANRGNSPTDLAAIRELGVPVFAFQIDSLPELARAARTLGGILGVQAEAESLATSWERRIASVQSVGDSVPENARPLVFFGGIAEPIYTVSRGSFIHDVIQRAGGRNVFADLPTAWPRIDLETLVRRNPDIILVGYHAATERDIASLREAPGWRTIKAVREGKVYILGDAIMREGPRLVDALEEVSRVLYPRGKVLSQ
ncbi:MAG TPA: cobalamin-binding protein [Candidatus Latescibacteria bacterium]|nr:cobalamin-binding protein [Candidatus Latescibacterota bacterium]